MAEKGLFDYFGGGAGNENLGFFDAALGSLDNGLGYLNKGLGDTMNFLGTDAGKGALELGKLTTSYLGAQEQNANAAEANRINLLNQQQNADWQKNLLALQQQQKAEDTAYRDNINSDLAEGFDRAFGYAPADNKKKPTNMLGVIPANPIA